ncbi:OmpA family protein [Roseibacterium sp. SDUM158017]|uniref:OmpA family protein n=1 Tax=Roseicyclus salinarum TaxID=3036773 RepID=UPI002415417F|nr:OmpA family protein [Roseibacterium sp. SDUM158017]MDG4649841.1 OmpA family protein [Roseibacterium sp. SDUM158017]
MIRTPFFAVILSFIAAGALSLGVAVVAAITIERRSIEAVSEVLEEEGFHWAEVDADGLQIFLRGTAPDEASRFLAESRAGSVIDGDRVVNEAAIEIRDTAAAPRFSLDMLRNGDGIQIIGLVPGVDGGDEIADAIESIADGTEVTDMVETADYPAPDTWISALGYGLRALRQLPRSKVTVYADRVEVEAISDSPEQQSEWIADLQAARPAGVEVVLDISAPRPVFSPFTLRAVRDAEGSRFEACAADTARAHERILAAARAAGMEGDIACPIGLGVPSPSWAQAVEIGLNALHELPGGTLTFSDAYVTLVAAQGTGQDEFDRVIGELDAALPEVFTLQGVLPEAENDAGGPARFFANLDADTGVRLRGRLPEGPVGQSVAAFAVAVFGRERTDLATRAVPDLPQGWSVRAMAGLRALAQLHEGELTLEPDTLRIRGRTGDADLRSELTRQLSDALGAGADFQLDIRYDEELDPIASMPTAEECVASIQSVQEDRKIVFEPGSVEITDEAGEILDQIAEILPNCMHVAMEIGGHTDSQGREEMNLGLSQSRADAVLNGLLARGVLVSNLTARGYGESQPIADNGTEAGRERNRRIEFRLQDQVDALEARAEAEAQAEARAEAFALRPEPRPDSIAEAAAAAAPPEEE